jgi:ribonuclease HII
MDDRHSPISDCDFPQDALSMPAMSRTPSRKEAPARLPLKEEIVRPTFRRERRAYKNGIWPVAGCDEAGRGPLAGPVVAAAVVLDPDRIPRGLNDSKKLTFEEREKLYGRICATASRIRSTG